MKKLLILLGIILIGNSAFACYGNFCSSYVGVIYDIPAKVWNKNVPPVVTSPRAILDNPQEFLNSPTGDFKGNFPTLDISNKPKKILCTNGSTCTVVVP